MHLIAWQKEHSSGGEDLIGPEGTACMSEEECTPDYRGKVEGEVHTTKARAKEDSVLERPHFHVYGQAEGTMIGHLSHLHW